MKRYVFVALAGLSVGAAPLAAQQDPAERIETALERAAAAGLPTSILESRIAEGRAKGVSLDRIAVAVERRAAALARARDAMSGQGRPVTEAGLAAGADAIEAGLHEAPLRAVIQQARTEDTPVAIAVLTYLFRDQQLPVEQALNQVTAALAQGPEALRNLPAQAAAARARRGPPQGVGPGGQLGPGAVGGPPSGVPAPTGRPGGGKPSGVGRPGGIGG